MEEKRKSGFWRDKNITVSLKLPLILILLLFGMVQIGRAHV